MLNKSIEENRILLKNKKHNQKNTSPNISDETIFKFQELFLKKNGCNISFEEAESKVLSLLTFMKLICKPIKQKMNNAA